MSTFDPAAFEAMTIDQANETTMTPVPEGDNYKAFIEKWKVRGVEIKKGDRAGSTVPILGVTWKIEADEKLKKSMNMEEIRVTQDIWLDLNENGALAFGPNQNVQLGRLREAVGLNKPGKTFAFSMLEGQGPCNLNVIVYEGEDGLPRNRVTKVAKA